LFVRLFFQDVFDQTDQVPEIYGHLLIDPARIIFAVDQAEAFADGVSIGDIL